jgi:alpha-aminoadipate/glutamate carrier protein LysW
MALCPECDATIEMDEDEVEEGQVLECPECDAHLEVVNTHPLELDVIPEEKDDEDDAEA